MRVLASCLLVISAVTVTDAGHGCTTCPSNACSQNEAHIGFCKDEVYVSEAYVCSYSGSQQRSRRTYYGCGWFNLDRCSRDVTYYESVTRYQTCYRSRLNCQRRCCSGFQSSGGNCLPYCSGGCHNDGVCVDPEVCECPSNWQGQYCNVDVNECKMNNGGCSDYCSNSPGSYSCGCREYADLDPDGRHCTCRPGFIQNDDTVTCDDIDECAVDNGGCDHNCTNTPSSHICQCDPGYELHVDLKMCLPICTGGCLNGGECVAPETCNCSIGWTGQNCESDIDECTEGISGCHQHCTNTVPGYTCSCDTGYTLNEDGHLCDDIDECASNIGGCAHLCHNTIGNFYCSCRPGYTLQDDNFTCVGEGGWSPWSHGPCSHNCGNGTRTSTRNCTTPDHPDCCPGNSTIVETCVEDSCPGNGSWIKVTNCSVECGGGGIQVFVRDCPAFASGGKECEVPTYKIEYCGYCPCDGGWSPWSHGPCSHTCGNGTRTSTRNCTTPDHPDCCPGNSTMVETCSEGSCPSCSSCTWTVAWPCSKTCGGKGMQVLVRECDGGNPCEGPSHKVEPCGYCPCEGGWSPWSHGPCSHTCGNGTRTSTRNCTTPDHPDCCPGNSTMVETCSEGSCAIHGGWSDWMEVLPCNKPCGGGGARVLMRECNNPEPANGGNDCVGEGLKIDYTCADCPCEGGWSPWSRGPCSHKCGKGTRTSTRNCTTPDHPDCCPGNSTIIEACEERKCSAVDGGWSSWQEAIACTATCGGGTRYLTRRCNNPTPANGGRDCEGDTFKADICAECPCDAHWSSWTQGICSGPCGQNGTAVATRKCNGSSQCCRGKRTRTETCTSRPC